MFLEQKIFLYVQPTAHGIFRVGTVCVCVFDFYNKVNLFVCNCYFLNKVTRHQPFCYFLELSFVSSLLIFFVWRAALTLAADICFQVFVVDMSGI